MPFKRFVEIGRVALITRGRDAGKIATIVDIIDQNRALLDGPCSGVLRQARRYNELHLTDFVMKIPRGATERTVRVLWENNKISEKWNETSWAKRMQMRAKRASLTDFERYKLRVAKVCRNRLIHRAFVSIRRPKNKAALRDRKRVELMRSKAKEGKKERKAKAEKKAKAKAEKKAAKAVKTAKQ